MPDWTFWALTIHLLQGCWFLPGSGQQYGHLLLALAVSLYLLGLLAPVRKVPQLTTIPALRRLLSFLSLTSLIEALLQLAKPLGQLSHCSH